MKSTATPSEAPSSIRATTKVDSPADHGLDSGRPSIMADTATLRKTTMNLFKRDGYESRPQPNHPHLSHDFGTRRAERTPRGTIVTHRGVRRSAVAHKKERTSPTAKEYITYLIISTYKYTCICIHIYYYCNATRVGSLGRAQANCFSSQVTPLPAKVAAAWEGSTRS